MTFNIGDNSHRRFNALTGEWILVSPHRSKRPWQGQEETVQTTSAPAHDPDCYLCAGNKRINGEFNPDYKGPFCFTNDFSALTTDTPAGQLEDPLFQARSERGLCKVICFSEDHSRSLPQMSTPEIKKVVDLWQAETRALSQLDYIQNIQIFENKGSTMGCSNPHPHGQIWAQESIPDAVLKECNQQDDYFKEHGQPLLATYLKKELQQQERVKLRMMNDE